MGILRNSINIEGIISEEDIPNKMNGQMIRYSEIETLYVPDDKPEIKNIYEISMNVKIKSSRTVHAPFGKIIIVDGIKEYKIIYTENTEFNKVNILYLKVPYNTFIELPRGIDGILDTKIYILDAYFDLLESKKIYGNFVYLVDVHYNKEDNKKILSNFQNSTLEENHSLGEIDTLDSTIEEISISKENFKREKEDTFIDIEEEIL